MLKDWEKYEDTATHLLNLVKQEFGLKAIEGKQKVKGAITNWEIDAKGVKENGMGFLIIECRRYSKAKQSQDKVAALAFTIEDTGATGGIIVSPLGLQEGAQKIANAENIISVKIDKNSTPKNFTIDFLQKLFIGVEVIIGEVMDVTLTTN